MKIEEAESPEKRIYVFGIVHVLVNDDISACIWNLCSAINAEQFSDKMRRRNEFILNHSDNDNT